MNTSSRTPVRAAAVVAGIALTAVTAIAATDSTATATTPAAVATAAPRAAAPTADPPACPATLHDAYQVTGPDGMSYDGWHPPTVTDPATKQVCSFQHEHGDDPKTSDIYQWTVDNLSADGRATGIPFGYVNHMSMQYPGGAHRHEDGAGQKVFVANDVRQLRADGRGYRQIRVQGRTVPVTCDYLIKVHQGSHSADALKNNAHELIYALSCNDGTAMVTLSLAMFGQPNEYHAGCDERRVETSGSNLPGQAAGRRLIPDRSCIDREVLVGPAKHSNLWGLYERWEAAVTLRTATGVQIAAYDPWFGVRNPARYANADGSIAKSADLTGQAVAGPPWSRIADGRVKAATAFNGAQRDLYLQHSSITNAGGPRIWYTDPYGGNASTTPFQGSVRQMISPVRTDTTELKRQAFGFSTDYGPPGSGVVAPN